MKIKNLLNQASALGLRLEPRGDKLLVTPAENCTAEIVAELRRHKVKVLAVLRGKSPRMNPDRAASLHVLKQLLAGEFDGCEDSTRASLIIGLRGIRHPLCAHALERLRTNSPT